MSSFLLSLIFLARLMNQRVLFTEGSLLSNSPMVWTNTPRMLKENRVRRLLSKVKLRISLSYPPMKERNLPALTLPGDQTLGWSLTLVRRGLYPGHVRRGGEGTLGYYYAGLLIRSGQARSQTLTGQAGAGK